MVEHPQPVLVYHRIEANRRNTRLLMAAFFVLLQDIAGDTLALAQPWLVEQPAEVGHAASVRPNSTGLHL
jgi:hypothetical protein